MSPERVSRGGQLRSDWQRKEIGRLRVTHGRTLREHQRALDLLDELYDNDQLDVIRAYQAKRVTMKELLSAKKKKGHRRDDVLVNLRLQQPLWATLEQLTRELPGTRLHRVGVLSQFNKLAASKAGARLGPRAKVADLLTVDWRAYRKEVRVVPAKELGDPPTTEPLFGSPYTWNFFRRALLARMTTLLGSADAQFRLDLRKALGPKEKEPLIEVDLAPETFWELVAKAPELVQPAIVCLAITGMRLNTEYRKATAADLRPDIHAIRSPGSKTADAEGYIYVPPAYWPWIEAGIPAPIQTTAIRRNFKAAARAIGRPELTLHMLRHLYVMLLLDGGLPIHEVQAAARHADPKMTMRYARTQSKQRAAGAMESSLGTPAAQPPDLQAKAKPGRRGWARRTG